MKYQVTPSQIKVTVIKSTPVHQEVL